MSKVEDFIQKTLYEFCGKHECKRMRTTLDFFKEQTYEFSSQSRNVG